jgi:hypothetical protein
MSTMASLISPRLGRKSVAGYEGYLWGGQDVFLISLRRGLKDALNAPADMGEIVLEGAHPAAASFCSTASLSCRAW